MAGRVDAGKLATLLRDSPRAARRAGLRYEGDAAPGWTRKKRGSSFAYFDARGHRIQRPRDISRVRALAIPPAWTRVWISPSPDAHIQATGRDARGRKQYKYHSRFRELREAAKYAHILEFAEQLPALRRHAKKDLARAGLPREKVLAAVIDVMQRTCVRVGNDRYAEVNGSYGLTTLRDRHLRVAGAHLTFRFKGKGGKLHEQHLDDPKLARILQHCRDVPGQRLFQYLEPDGHHAAVTSGDVNDYLRAATGEAFSAKDFRTWAGTLLALHALAATERCSSPSDARKRVKQALEGVASELGNTVAICRKSYVHPAVIRQYSGGQLCEAVARAMTAARRKPVRGLRRPEAVALYWLRELAGKASTRTARKAGRARDPDMTGRRRAPAGRT
jgi:DNA topoisomerase-1